MLFILLGLLVARHISLEEDTSSYGAWFNNKFCASSSAATNTNESSQEGVVIRNITDVEFILEQLIQVLFKLQAYLRTGTRILTNNSV